MFPNMRKIESVSRNFQDLENFSRAEDSRNNSVQEENKLDNSENSARNNWGNSRKNQANENNMNLTAAQKTIGAAALKCLEYETFEDRNWITDRIDRIDFLLNSFGGRNLPRGAKDAEYIYEATRALDFSSEQTPRENLLARKELLEDYLTNPEISNHEAQYVLSILGDLFYLDNEANMYRANPNIYQSGAPSSHLRAAIRDDGNAEIAREDWGSEVTNLDFERIGQVVEQVNLESIVIKSLQLLDDMLKSSDHSDAEMFHKINEAEYFYAPIAEVIGFDAMAAALRDKATQIRLMKLGENEILEKSWEQFRETENFDIQEIFSMISDGEFLAEKVAGSSRDGGEKVNFGDMVLKLEKNQEEISGTYRYKTVGSIAKKMLNKESYRETLPRDLIGLTFVFPDSKILKKSLLKIIETLQNQVDFKATSSRDSAFFVQATEENLDDLFFAMSEIGCEPSFKIVEDWEFQVAKFAFSPKNKPNANIEIQFLTKENQKSGRIGESAHILYKLNQNQKKLDPEIIDRQIAIMQKINQRRNWIGRPKIKTESLARAEKIAQSWFD